MFDFMILNNAMEIGKEVSFLLLAASLTSIALVIGVSAVAVVYVCRNTNATFPEATQGIACVIKAWRRRPPRR
jgi:hypothetical protein